jgi:hypothetical protein
MVATAEELLDTAKPSIRAAAGGTRRVPLGQAGPGIAPTRLSPAGSAVELLGKRRSAGSLTTAPSPSTNPVDMGWWLQSRTHRDY